MAKSKTAKLVLQRDLFAMIAEMRVTDGVIKKGSLSTIKDAIHSINLTPAYSAPMDKDMPDSFICLVNCSVDEAIDSLKTDLSDELNDKSTPADAAVIKQYAEMIETCEKLIAKGDPYRFFQVGPE